MKEEVYGLKEEVSRLNVEDYGLKGEVHGLKEEVSKLNLEDYGLKREVSKLKEENSGLKEEVSKLKEEVSGLKDSGSASQVCNLSLLFIALTIVKVLVEIFAQQSSCDVMEMVTQWSYFLAVPTGPAHKVTTVSIKEKYMFK